jgi:hypothetical protein
MKAATSEWITIGQAQYGSSNHGNFALISTLELSKGSEISKYQKKEKFTNGIILISVPILNSSIC